MKESSADKTEHSENKKILLRLDNKLDLLLANLPLLKKVLNDKEMEDAVKRKEEQIAESAKRFLLKSQKKRDGKK